MWEEHIFPSSLIFKATGIAQVSQRFPSKREKEVQQILKQVDWNSGILQFRLHRQVYA